MSVRQLTSAVLGMQKVQDPVGQKLHRAALDAVRVQAPQLALALVVLAQIAHLERDARVDLVHLDGKLVLDALHRQILAHRLELVADVRVVVLGAPLFLEQLERLYERRQWSYCFRVRSGGEAEVALFELGAGTDDGVFVPVDDVWIGHFGVCELGGS